MFDFAPVGIACAAVGVAYVALIGWRLLPASRTSAESPAERFDLADYIAEVRVPEGSSAIGKRVRDLDELAAQVVDLTADLGEPPDPRGFRGHLTLGRLRGDDPPAAGTLDAKCEIGHFWFSFRHMAGAELTKHVAGRDGRNGSPAQHTRGRKRRGRDFRSVSRGET